MTENAEGPKHRSPKRRWWQRAERPVPEPVWVPGWGADWRVVEPDSRPVVEPATEA